jgi:hypothetical protein
MIISRGIGKVAGGTGDETETADDPLFVVELLPTFGRESVENRVLLPGHVRIMIEYLLRRSGMESCRPEKKSHNRGESLHCTLPPERSADT